MSGHTKEPWVVEMSEAPVGCPFAWVSAGDGDQYTGITAITLGPVEANARRIVSCVNALAGLNPDAVADVVAALEAMTDLAHGYAEYIAAVPSSELERHPYLPGVEDEINSARTALARIRGEG